MSLSLTKSPDWLRPVYGQQEFIFNCPAQDYFLIDVSIVSKNDDIRLELLPNGDNIKVDFANILQNYFDSSIYIHPNDLFYVIPDALVRYKLKVVSYVNDNSTNIYYSGDYYCFNGVDQFDSTYDANKYIFDSSAANKFLNTFNADRKLHLNDSAYLQFFQGVPFATYDSSFNGLLIQNHKKNGTIISQTINYSFSDNNAKIVSINCSPVLLNSLYPALSIDEQTDYYTVKEKNSLSEAIKFYIYDVDNRFDRYYRLAYVDSNGATEMFNFDLMNLNNIKIDKQTYKVNNQWKQFGNNITDKYTINTNWLDENESLSLKDLWVSPYVCISDSSTLLTPIIIDTNSIDILRRRNQKNISYKLDFSKSKEYYVQLR